MSKNYDAVILASMDELLELAHAQAVELGSKRDAKISTEPPVLDHAS